MLWTILKGIPGAIKTVFSLSKYLRNYFGLKNAAPRTFTIGTKTETGSIKFTTGTVRSISLWQVIIDGYQVDDPVSEHGTFAIKLHSIQGVNYHPDTYDIPKSDAGNAAQEG